MASFDFGNQINCQIAISGRSVTANTNATAVDTNGYEGAAFQLQTGTAPVINAIAFVTLSFTEGDDTNTLNSTAIDSDRILRTASVSAANTIAWASVANTKRYVFAHLRVGGAQAAAVNTFAAVTGVLGIPHNAPTT
jgi:hypothetical protein